MQSPAPARSRRKSLFVPRSGAVVVSCLAIMTLIAVTGDASATSAQAWVLRNRSDFVDARMEGLTLSSEGRLSLAPALVRIAETPEPLLWCLAFDGKGRLYAGGGNEGQVFRISPKRAETFFDAPEVEIHAIAFDPQGRLYAASSPEGKVYRVAEGGSPETFFDPDAIYIWALALDGSSNVLVATGQPGRIYRVSPAGKSEVLLEAREDHIRTLIPDGAGGFIAGSDGSGVVYRISPDGKAVVLSDTPAREIAALAVSGGEIFAAGLSPAPGGRPTSETRGPVTRVRVTAEGGSSETQEEPDTQQDASRQQPRPQTQETFTGAVYRITSQGYTRKIWESRDALPFSLLPMKDGRILVGTGDRGRLIALSPDGDAGDVASVEASQVNALIGGSSGLFAAASNLGGVFELRSGFEKEGSAVGPVRDAGFTSRWGTLSWDADTPPGTGLSFQVRTGDTEDPDATWSDWSTSMESARGSLIDRPAARFLQWRAALRSTGDATPVLKAVRIHYLPDNMPPAVDLVEIQNPGVNLQSSGAPSGGEESGDQPARRSSPPKRSYQRGMRSVTWKATDSNNDPLVAEVLYKGEDESVWKTLKAGVEEDFLAWDSTAMPDGIYRIRVIVSDAEANPPGKGLTSQRDSAPFDVDNTPPTVNDVKAKLGSRFAEVTATASDSFSVIGDVSYSIDASDWTVLLPEDGVADASRETYRFKTPVLATGEHSIVVRVRDRAGNVSSGKTIIQVP